MLAPPPFPIFYLLFLICSIFYFCGHNFYLCVRSGFWMIETLLMKGLTLNCMDRKSEAYEQFINLAIVVYQMIQLWFLFWYRMTLKVMFAAVFMVSFICQRENTGRRSSAIELHWELIPTILKLFLTYHTYR